MIKNLLFISFLFITTFSTSQTLGLKWHKNYWSKQATTGGSYCNSFMCKNGDVIATFLIKDSMLFEGKLITVSQGSKFFIIRYDSTGKVIWELPFYGPKKNSSLPVEHMFMGDNESVYLTISFDSLLHIGNDTSIFALGGLVNSCVCKVNASGKLSWIQLFTNNFLDIGYAAPGGVLVRGWGNQSIRWNGTTFSDRSILYFDKSGNLAITSDSIINSIENMMMGPDSSLLFRSNCPGNGYIIISGDTIRNPKSSSCEVHSRVSADGKLLLWHNIVENAKIATSFNYHQLLIDKKGNSYVAGHVIGDSVKVGSRFYNYPKNTFFSILSIYNPVGQLIKVVRDSLPQIGETQTMFVNLSEDSSKLLVYLKFNLGYAINGIANFLSGEAVLLVLDIANNFNCIKYYKIYYRNFVNYSPNPNQVDRYGVSFAFLQSFSSIQIDNTIVSNTGGQNVAVFYFDEKSMLGYNRVDENSFVSVFPNPCQNKLHISGTNIKNIEMMDMLGRTLDVSYSENKEEIDMSPLNAGVYFVRINNARTFKVVKQ